MPRPPDPPAEAPRGRALERRALAGVLRHAADGHLPPWAATLGLDPAAFGALCAGAGAVVPAPASPAVHAVDAELLEPLAALMWAERSGDGDWTRLALRTVACACFGARHLWQDIGLAGRPEVTQLIETHAPRLAAGNVRELKWKRYLFERLGQTLARPGLRPPRCEGCGDYAQCWGDNGAPIRMVRR